MAVSNCRADLPECLPELPGQLRSATAKNKAWDVGHSHQDHSDCRNSVTRAVIDGPGPLQPEVNRKDRFMKKASIIVAITALAALGVATAASAASGNPGGFEHAPIISVDGEAYYSAGAPDGPDGATDIPGHYWKQAGPNQFVGKHYNTGPFGTPSWWSSDAPDGELLYTVHGIIDTWSPETAKAYADRGYKHYHELLSVADGTLHPTKVMWLKHTAVATFTLDGGPMPSFGHDVTPGIDVAFIPNGMTPYNP